MKDWVLYIICFVLGICFSKLGLWQSKKRIRKKEEEPLQGKAKGSQEEDFDEDNDFDNADLKMVFLVRKDLKMGVGKIGAQVAHAAVGLCYEIIEGKSDYHQRALQYWNQFGAKKIVLSADSLELLKETGKQCKKAGIPHIMISDAGHTEVPAGTITVLGIGVDSSEKINPFTKQFKLLR